MAKIITFSTEFPKYHPRTGEPTYFVEKILNQLQDFSFVTNELAESQMFLLGKESYIENRIKTGFKKSHTIRNGRRFKKGDFFSPRIWSGKPYNSKQIIIAPDIEIKNVWNILIEKNIEWQGDNNIFIGDMPTGIYLSDKGLKQLANNDGFGDEQDLVNWFPDLFDGQIICWNDKINY